jgi:hypothetical protein
MLHKIYQKTYQWVLLVGIFLLTTVANAQSTDASFLGMITDDKGEPLPGVTIGIKNESTGFKTGTLTQADGRFQFRQLPLGGPYTVTASFVGYASKQSSELYLNQGSKVVVDFQLTESSTQLNEVIVTEKFVDDVKSFGAATKVTANNIKNLPLEGRNFSGLARLSPLAGADPSSLAGQRSGSTNITIDGGNARSPLWAGTAGSGPYAISQEAIREFEVVTNAYDVSQGRQAGGAVNAVTKSGTNTFTGAVFGYGRADELSSNYDIRGVKRTQNFSTYQWGFSLGGPIIKDKLHFYTAFDRQDAQAPVVITDINNEADERRFGIRKDTLEKAIAIARRLYGVSDNPQVGQFGNKTTNNTLFVRFDWTLNDKHKLTFRNNLTSFDAPINSGDNSSIVLRETYNKQLARSYTGLVSLRSSVSPSFTNELKVQYQYEYTAQETSDELPKQNIPRAIVTLVSPFPTAENPNATQRTTFQFGGQRFTPERTKYNQFHLINTSYLTKGKFNFTFGTDNFFTVLEDLFTSELNGRFFFNSMQDLENKKPSRYVREVALEGGEPVVKYNVFDWSLFGQVDFDLHPNINLAAGLRWDGTAFLTGAAYNPVVDRTLGIRTDRKPVDWNNLQPRAQLTWNVGGRNTDIVKIGGGAFSAMAMYYNQANNMLFSGTRVGSIDVSGAQVPTPDFISYRRDPSTAPGIPAGTPYVSTINAMGKNFEVPLTWKGNISYNRILWGDRLRIGINAMVSHTRNNYVYQERNLVDQPYFRIAREANRGVFVPADKINTNGTLRWQDSRKTTEVGRVLELVPDGYVNQWAVVVDATVRLGRDGYLNASYTYNDTKDNSSYNCCVANTSTFLPVKDDPRALSYGYSDTHFRSKLVINGGTPSWKGFVAGVIVTGTGGTPFAFHAYRAGTSLNGDFNEQNDLAFLFDPNSSSTPEALRTGINAWLNNPQVAQHAKDYYLANVGKIAPRNGGVNPFSAVVDLRLTKKFRTYKNQGLELSADLFNVANLLNKSNGVNRNLSRELRLLNISGFDKEALQYNYTFNSPTASNPIGGTPWRLQLGVRYSF